MAQTPVFNVLAAKGEVKIIRAGSADQSSVKIGSPLFMGDKLVTSSDNYLALLHKSGKTTEISSAGNHDIGQLERDLPPGNSGVLERLYDFVLLKIDEDKGDINANYKENLKASAGVSRATGGLITLLVKEQKKINQVIGSNVRLRWVSTENVKKYNVTILSAFGDKLGTYTVADEFVDLDINQPPMDKENYFVVKIDSESPPMSSVSYQIQRASDQTLINEMVDAFEEYSEESASHALMLALFFEERGFYLDALTHYEKAMQSEPEVESYRQLRDQFILNSSLGR